MPILPPGTATPYDSAEVILNAARVRLNDKLSSLFSTGGTILNNTDAFSHQVFNNAYRTFQAKLADLGFDRFNKEIIIAGCPVVGDTDPATQTYIDWFQFFDGLNYSTTPVLPDDLIEPLWISERWTGRNSCFPHHPNMENMVDGFPGWAQTTANRFWQWRDDKIWMPGSQMSMDLRIGYLSFLPDLADVAGLRWYKQPVPIMRCLEPMAWYICFEFAVARRLSSPEMAESLTAAAAEFKDEAQRAAEKVFRRDVQKNQRVNVRRIPRNRNSRGSWGSAF